MCIADPRSLLQQQLLASQISGLRGSNHVDILHNASSSVTIQLGPRGKSPSRGEGCE